MRLNLINEAGDQVREAERRYQATGAEQDLVRLLELKARSGLPILDERFGELRVLPIWLFELDRSTKARLLSLAIRNGEEVNFEHLRMVFDSARRFFRYLLEALAARRVMRVSFRLLGTLFSEFLASPIDDPSRAFDAGVSVLEDLLLTHPRFPIWVVCHDNGNYFPEWVSYEEATEGNPRATDLPIYDTSSSRDWITSLLPEILERLSSETNLD